jgi:Flp pilus assembly protein TadG
MHALRRLVRTRLPEGESGSALVEFCWLAVLLLIPLTWILLAVFRTQGTAYAVTSAAREAGRAYVTTPGSGEAKAEARAFAAARLSMSDFNLTLAEKDLKVTGGLNPGSAVTVQVTASVPLPFVPKWIGASSVKVNATHVELVDQYR